jgi:hypothetical protein
MSFKSSNAVFACSVRTLDPMTVVSMSAEALSVPPIWSMASAICAAVRVFVP